MQKHTQILFWIGCYVLGVLHLGCGQSGDKAVLYLEKTKGLANIIMKQSSSFVSMNLMYNTVWEYAKVTEMDFDAAYDEMMGTRPDSLKLDMDVNKVQIAKMMVLAEKPPKDMDRVHERLTELYQMYLDFHRFMMKEPSGAQEKYNEEFEIYVNDMNAITSELNQYIAEAYQKLSL